MANALLDGVTVEPIERPWALYYTLSGERGYLKAAHTWAPDWTKLGPRAAIHRPAQDVHRSGPASLRTVYQPSA
jgi:hypothetical protein